MFAGPTGRISIGVLVLLGVAATTWFVGCGSEEAGAKAEVQNGTAAITEAGAADKPPAPPRPKLLPGAKTVALTRAGDRPYDKTFDDIRFDIEPGQPFHREMLPEAIEALAGQRIRIRGFMLPTPLKRGIREFVLVRDNQECCFGPGAALYDCILVKMKEGKTAEFSIRPIAAEGTFDIREFRLPDGTHLAIYHLDADSAR